MADEPSEAEQPRSIDPGATSSARAPLGDDSGRSPGLAAAEGEKIPASDPLPSFKLKRRPMWPFFAVLLLIVGAIGGGVFYFLRKPEPLRVLIAIDFDGTSWEGSREASKLSDHVSELLKNVGFEPVKSGDPEVDKILEKAKTPEEAARKLKAAFIIGGHLSPTFIAQGIGSGFVEARVDAAITVRQIEDPAGKVDEGHVSSWSGAPTKQGALDMLADSLGDMVFDEAAPRMMAHPTIQSLLEGDDVKLLQQIQKAKGFVALRKKRLDAVAKAYADLDKEHADGPQKIRKITYHGSFSEADSLAGAGPNGFLVQTADVAPFVSPGSADLGYFLRLERLEWRAASGGDAKVLWSGYHLYGYPSVAPAGAPIVFVEDIFGWAKTLTVVGANGEAKRLRVDPEIRFVDPQVAPGGKWAALYEKPCRACASTFVIVSLEDGHDIYDRKAATNDPSVPGNEIYGGYTWLDENRAVLFVKPRIEPVEALDDPDLRPKEKEKEVPKATLDVIAIDVSSGSPKVTKIASLDPSSSYSSPSASPNGKVLALVHGTDAGNDIALLDVGTGQLTDTHAGSSAQNPQFSPDGTKIVFGERGNIELVEVAGSKTVELTDNEFEERYPRFSSDGKTVFFESLGQDPSFRRRSVAVIASVEVAP